MEKAKRLNMLMRYMQFREAESFIEWSERRTRELMEQHYFCEWVCTWPRELPPYRTKRLPSKFVLAFRRTYAKVLNKTPGFKPDEGRKDNDPN